MKSALLLTLFLISSQSYANSVQCVLQEVNEGQSIKQEMVLEKTANPHGSLIQFSLQVLPQYSGFVALSNGYIVIHLYDSTTNSAISVQSTGQSEQYARLQYLLPDTESLDAIIIECAEL